MRKNRFAGLHAASAQASCCVSATASSTAAAENVPKHLSADVFESITAAIYLDSAAWRGSCAFVLHYIEPAAQSAGERPFKDHKTMLQEIIQQNPGERLEYVLTVSGPDHDSTSP